MPNILIDRLLNKTIEQGDCWEFVGSRNSDGYGSIRADGRTLGAHRVAYELFVGPIQEGMSVLHTCDNRACINPEHLFLGTQYDNVRDMINKGRSYFRSNAKITLEQSTELRLLYLDGMSINDICDLKQMKYHTVWWAVNQTTENTPK